jgi:hypothetical protein
MPQQARCNAYPVAYHITANSIVHRFDLIAVKHPSPSPTQKNLNTKPAIFNQLS